MMISATQEDEITQSQSGGGEDESSTEHNGDDSHLHDDQKAPSYKEAAPEDDDAERSGPKQATKVQDLAKAGRSDFDPNAGQE